MKDINELQKSTTKVIDGLKDKLVGNKNQEKEIAKKINDEADKKVHASKRSEDIERRF